MARRALLIVLITAGFVLIALAQSKDSSGQKQAVQPSVNQAQQQEWGCRDEIRQVTQAAKMVRISPGVTQANARTKVQPDTAGVVVTGNDSVYVEVVIGRDGSVSCARSIDVAGAAASSELQSKAVEAAKQWKFKPYLLNGKPVYVDGVLQFNFAGR